MSERHDRIEADEEAAYQARNRARAIANGTHTLDRNDSCTYDRATPAEKRQVDAEVARRLAARPAPRAARSDAHDDGGDELDRAMRLFHATNGRLDGSNRFAADGDLNEVLDRAQAQFEKNNRQAHADWIKGQAQLGTQNGNGKTPAYTPPLPDPLAPGLTFADLEALADDHGSSGEDVTAEVMASAIALAKESEAFNANSYDLFAESFNKMTDEERAAALQAAQLIGFSVLAAGSAPFTVK